MAFLDLFGDDRSIYAITGDGSLLWYRDDLRDGSNGPNAERGWAPGSGSQIGRGWNGFAGVFSGGNGVIYAIRETGELLWYRDDLRDGSNGPNAERGWAPGSGSQIGRGWNGFAGVFSGGNGVIYAIRETGELLWYRDDLRDGSNGPNAERGWAPGSGSQIGRGWNGFAGVFSGGNGVIYAIRETGELLWYRDDLRDGSNGPNAERGWAPGSGNQIGHGWADFGAVFTTGKPDGIIYAVTATSDLLWYRDDLRDGTNGADAARGWAARSGSAIGIGWSIEPKSLIAGYASPLSAGPGDTVEIKLSARRQSPCTVQVFRLRENDDGSVGVPVADAFDAVVGVQPVPADAWESGCGWATTVDIDVDPAWRSGLYSARVVSQDGSDACDVVFVVRAGAEKSAFLLIANTNCWNAYNAWGGVSNYSGHAEVVTLSFDRPNPGAAPQAFDQGAYTPNHLTAAEIWVSTWLEDAGYEFDTCSDWDFHHHDSDPADYRAVILSTHPEYWSQHMAQQLADYVAGGGRLLYWGGNGIFRQVQFADGGRSMITGSSPAWFCGNAWADGPKPRELLGVAYDIAHDGLYPARCGYVIDDPGHPFLAGTGLKAGDVVGGQGRNGGGACGWEVDTAIDFGEGNGAAPAGEQILGHGQLVTADGYTGHMTYYDNEAGGFVFAIGSISFGGSLPEDAELQVIARNALDSCLP